MAESSSPLRTRRRSTSLPAGSPEEAGEGEGWPLQWLDKVEMEGEEGLFLMDLFGTEKVVIWIALELGGTLSLKLESRREGKVFVGAKISIFFFFFFPSFKRVRKR